MRFRIKLTFLKGENLTSNSFMYLGSLLQMEDWKIEFIKILNLNIVLYLNAIKPASYIYF